MSTRSIVALIVIAVLAAGYIAWLDSGCAITGGMTSHGKICIN